MSETELERLVVTLTSDIQGYLKAMNEAQKATNNAVAKMSQSFENLSGAVSNALAAFGISGGLRTALHQFQEAEMIGIRLEATLKAQGKEVERLMGDYEGYAQQLQATTTLEDDYIKKLLASAEAFGISGAAAKEAVESAAAIAALKGGSAETYMRLAQALARGDTDALKVFQRLLPELRGATSDEELLAKAQKLVVAGTEVMNKEMKTTSGLMTMLRRDLGNMLEGYGQLLADGIKPLVEMGREVVAFFAGLPGWIKGGIVALLALVSATAAMSVAWAALSRVGVALSGTIASVTSNLWLNAAANKAAAAAAATKAAADAAAAAKAAGGAVGGLAGSIGVGKGIAPWLLKGAGIAGVFAAGIGLSGIINDLTGINDRIAMISQRLEAAKSSWQGLQDVAREQHQAQIQGIRSEQDPVKRQEEATKAIAETQRQIALAERRLRDYEAATAETEPTILSLWQSGRDAWNANKQQVEQTTGNLARLRRELDALQEAAAGASAQNQLDKMLESWKKRLDNIGLTEDQQRIRDLAAMASSPAQVQQAKDALKNLQDKEMKQANQDRIRDLDDQVARLGLGADEAERLAFAQEQAKKHSIPLAQVLQAMASTAERERAARRQIGAQKVEDQVKALEDQAEAINLNADASQRLAIIRQYMKDHDLTLAQAEELLKTKIDRMAKAQVELATKTAIDRVKSLEDEAARLGMAADAAERYALAQEFVNRTGKTMTEALSILAPLTERMLRAQSARSDQTLRDRIRDLKLEADRLGLAADASERLAMAQQMHKTTGEPVADILRRLNQEFEIMADLQAALEGQRVFESVKTPAEKAEAEIENLNNLLRRGAISWEVYEKAVGKVNEQLQGTARSTQAVRVGTADAVAAMLSYQASLRPNLLAPGALAGPPGANAPLPPARRDTDPRLVELLRRIADNTARVAGNRPVVIQPGNVGG